MTDIRSTIPGGFFSCAKPCKSFSGRDYFLSWVGNDWYAPLSWPSATKMVLNWRTARYLRCSKMRTEGFARPRRTCKVLGRPCGASINTIRGSRRVVLFLLSFHLHLLTPGDWLVVADADRQWGYCRRILRFGLDISKGKVWHHSRRSATSRLPDHSIRGRKCDIILRNAGSEVQSSGG